MTAPDATVLPEPLDHAATRRALDETVAARWWQTSSFARVAGPDAASFLDGLCTQAVERVAVGTGVLGLFLDAKAKVVAPAVLHRLPDEPWTDPRRGTLVDAAPVLLVETLPDLVEPLVAHLRRFQLRAKATLEPVDVATIALLGPGAEDEALRARVLGEVAGSWSRVLEQSHPTWALLLTDSGACGDVVRDALPAAHVPLAAPDAVEAARIDAGVAGLHDLLPGRMPAEVGGMDAAVALDAGCYLGQEPVARLHFRGRANRTLRRIVVDGALEPDPASDDLEAALALRAPDAAVDSRALGRVTTWATGADGATVALAILRRELEAGDELRLAGSEAVIRVVDAAPAAAVDA